MVSSVVLMRLLCRCPTVLRVGGESCYVFRLNVDLYVCKATSQKFEASHASLHSMFILAFLEDAGWMSNPFCIFLLLPDDGSVKMWERRSFHPKAVAQHGEEAVLFSEIFSESSCFSSSWRS